MVPFYDEHGIRLSRVLTDRGTEFCGSQRRQYELYLAVEDIDHSRTETKSAQSTDVIDKGFLRRGLLNCCRAQVTAWRRAGHEVQALPRSPLSSLLLCGARARLWPCWAPTRYKTGVGGFGLLDPAPFLVAMTLDVAGVRGSLLSARCLMTGFEIEIAQLFGVQCRSCPKIALVLCQHTPDQGGEFARRRGGSDVLSASGLHPQKEAAQRAPGRVPRPSRPRPACRARVRALCLVIRPWWAVPGPDCHTLGFSPR